MKFENIKTVYDLKYWYYEVNPDGHFFDRKSMKFFGDTMKNFGMMKLKDKINLYRKNPVKHSIKSDFYFYPDGTYKTVTY